MSKRRVVTLKVDKKFRDLIKVESALQGKSICSFTRDLADEDVLFSEYMKSTKGKKKDIIRKGKGGFSFDLGF